MVRRRQPSLVDVMRGGPGAQWLAGAGAEWLAATENAQPLLFAIQVGMIRVIDARGMRYDAAIGLVSAKLPRRG